MPTSQESSRDRLLRSGKHLFATRGYENTSTINIAREAGTSESQLIKHFGSKDGLLAGIFDEGWGRMSAELERVQKIENPTEKLRALVSSTVDLLDGDPELRQLMIMESRRVRKGEVLVSRGFLEFTRMMDDAVREMGERGELRSGVRPEVLRSAVIGVAEGLMRDDIMARRMGHGEFYTRAELDHLLDLIVPALIQPGPEKSHASST